MLLSRNGSLHRWSCPLFRRGRSGLRRSSEFLHSDALDVDSIHNPSYNGFSGLRDRWMGANFGADAKTWIMLSELDFRRALDEYSSAEFRLGK